MDQIASQSTNQICTKHAQKKIKFIQVNDLSSSQNNPLFYCTHCVNKDLAFKGINYLLISQIIDEGDTNVIQKWPPINDYAVLDKLIQFTEHHDTSSSSSVVHQINQYFTLLKEEFIRKIDLCETKMINQALSLPFGKESILKRYQEISQISILKSILIDNHKRQDDSQQKICSRQFISEMESKKEKNSELLSKLLDQCQQKKQLINFEYPNLIKNQIFSYIDEIDFFQSKAVENSLSSSNQSVSKNSSSSKIMKLISNESNFCSKNFLAQTEALLDKINPLLSSLQFENMFEKNKSPIDYSRLNENKLNLMKDFVEHSIKVQTSKEYSQSIAITTECTFLKEIMDSKINFVNNNLNEQLSQLFIDIYPLLKQVNFTNGIQEKNKFDCFRVLSESQIEDSYQLIKKTQSLNGQNEYNSSETKKIKDKTQNVLKEFENVDEVFRKYPIYDLMLRKQNKEKPIDIKLIKTNYKDGNNRIQIHQNNQYSLDENYNGQYKGEDSNCVSDIVLEKEKKYIFRFKIEHQRSDDFDVLFGLMQKSKSDRFYGSHDNLSCHLRKTGNQIEYDSDMGISKNLKGDKLKLDKENEIEMRVWLGGQQLEILDYPNYQYKVALKDQYKKNLIEQNDLVLYLNIDFDKIKIILTSAVHVEDFND